MRVQQTDWGWILERDGGRLWVTGDARALLRCVYWLLEEPVIQARSLTEGASLLAALRKRFPRLCERIALVLDA